MHLKLNPLTLRSISIIASIIYIYQKLPFFYMILRRTLNIEH